MGSHVRSFAFMVTLVATAIGSGLVAGQQSLVQAQGQVIYLSGPSTSTVDGDLAPGCGGDRFGGGGQDNAVISDNGKLFFRAQLVSNTGTALAPTYLQRAYFYGDSKGNLVKVLRGGDPEPSGTIPNAILSTSSSGSPITGSPRISSNGIIMFGASIWDFVGSTITAANDTVLYVGTPGNFQILAREGDAAPGCGGALYSQAFSGMSQQPTCINSAGQALFQSSLLNTVLASPQVVTANNAAWFTGTAGNVQLMLRKGDTLPGGDGSTVSALGFVSQMNSLGQVVTDVTLTTGSGTPAVTVANNAALWLYTPGLGMSQILREGDATPIAGTTFNIAGNSWSVATGSSTFNINGQLLINADIIGAVTTGINDRALMLVSAAGHSVVFRRGDAAPGVAGASIDTVNNSSLCLNDNGRVAFEASLVGGGVTTANDSGIWTGTAGNLTLVAREGDVAPGTGGQLFGQTTGLFMVMNGSGQIMFQNSLTGGAGLTGSTWLWDPILGLQAQIAPRDQVEVQPGIFRTPYTTGGVQFTNGDGRPLCFANDGTVGVKLSMTDGLSYGSQAMVSVRIGSLTALPGKISEVTGGTHNLYLNAGLAHAGQTYVVAGSASGTFPGTPIGAYVVPLNIDAYTNLTLQSANVGPFVNTFSTLNADGRALAQLVIPPVPGLAGLVVNHAYGVIDAFNNLVFASEASRLEITP